MDSMVDVRAKALVIASSLKDVSSENVIDVADKIAKYIQKDADIPEYLRVDALATAMMDKVMQQMDKDISKTPLPKLDEPFGMFCCAK